LKEVVLLMNAESSYDNEWTQSGLHQNFKKWEVSLASLGIIPAERLIKPIYPKLPSSMKVYINEARGHIEFYEFSEANNVINLIELRLGQGHPTLRALKVLHESLLENYSDRKFHWRT